MGKVARRVLVLVALLAFLFVVLFPLYWMVISSTKSFRELFSTTPVFWPSTFTAKAYKAVLTSPGEDIPDLLDALRNSLMVAGGTVFCSLLLGTLAAYAIARLRFRGKALITGLVLVVYLFPAILLMVPLFAMFAKAGLHNKLSGLIVAYVAQTLPVSLLMLGNYFRSIPAEIEDAALVDGCSRLGVIWRVTIPLSVPAIASVALYVFVIAWNEFLFAYILLTDTKKFTAPVWISYLYSQLHTPWNQVMAASVLVTVPVIILFVWFEKYMEQGLTAGGVKG